MVDLRYIKMNELEKETVDNPFAEKFTEDKEALRKTQTDESWERRLKKKIDAATKFSKPLVPKKRDRRKNNKLFGDIFK